jgi:hypothetical protein
MTNKGTLLGLWIVRNNSNLQSDSTLLARVQDELYILAFSSAVRASACRDAFGAEGQPFLLVSRNLEQVVREARAAGARGFILDYDAARATFTSAHLLPASEDVHAA